MQDQFVSDLIEQEVHEGPRDVRFIWQEILLIVTNSNYPSRIVLYYIPITFGPRK